MKNLLTILTGMLILALTQPALAGWDKSAKGKIEQLEAAQEKAQADGESIAKATAILSDYNSTNNQYYNGLPVIVKEVKAIIEKNESFRDDELADINNQIEAFYDDYGVSNLKDLESNIGEHLNPKEWTGMQSPMPFSAYQYQQNLELFEAFEKEAKAAMKGAVANEEDEAARSVIKTSDFPTHNYDGGDLEQLQTEVRTALISPKVNDSDMLNIAITSGWTNGVFPITKIPFRTIGASVLFVDKDGDGNCRFNAYRMISIDGAALEYKSTKAGFGEGYAECEKAVDVNGGLNGENSGFFSNLTWFLLVSINLIGGTLILKEKLSPIKQLGDIIMRLQQHQTMIGLTAIGLGILSFLMAFLSLNLLQNIIPQATALLMGILLSAQFLISIREDAAEYIVKIKPFTHSLAISGIAVGVVHLFLSGGLYFI